MLHVGAVDAWLLGVEHGGAACVGGLVGLVVLFERPEHVHVLGVLLVAIGWSAAQPESCAACILCAWFLSVHCIIIRVVCPPLGKYGDPGMVHNMSGAKKQNTF